MREVEVYDAFGNNVAQGKTATQSSILQGNEGWAPSKGVDGQFNQVMQTNWEQGKRATFSYVESHHFVLTTLTSHTQSTNHRSLVAGRPRSQRTSCRS